MTAYYNEHDPKAAEWLRNLILMGEIAEGIVDERSIEDIRPVELLPYTQCHFFAGIGGWSRALRLAGVSDDTPVWTGSCPCQPFSAAGKGKGFADERHLWPSWFWLIQQCRPIVVFGEQVASNLAWLDLVQTDLEGEAYSVGSAIIGAHSVGAPHIRQRLYWVAEPQSQQHHWRRHARRGWREPSNDSGDGFLADSGGERFERRPETSRPLRNEATERRQGVPDVECSGLHGSVADAGSERRQQIGRGLSGDESAHGRQSDGDNLAPGNGEVHQLADADRERQPQRSEQHGEPRIFDPGQVATFWDNAGRCGPDAKGLYRPIEPGIEPLVNGLPGRVGLLRGYGNAIVPQAAVAFIKAYIGG